VKNYFFQKKNNPQFHLSLVVLQGIIVHSRSEHTPLTEQDFETLFKTHYEPLCHFAMGYLKDRDASDGIVQEVFVAFWQKRETVDPGKSVK
jgi:RNA polymerase sigma-70 factor (ECF subfamily)